MQIEQHFSTLIADILYAPFPINGNQNRIAIYAGIINNVITRLGWEEHTSDWDPYLKITKTDGTSFETTTGYENIVFGQLKDEEQETAFRHSEEIITIGFFLDNPDNEEEPILTFIPLTDIDSISLQR